MDIDFFIEERTEKKEKRSFSFQIFRLTIWRILRYSSVRLLTIILTVGFSLYLTLMVINLGGYVDTIMEGRIYESVGLMAMAGAFDEIPSEEREEFTEQLIWEMEEAAGLHEPLAIRTARWWFKGITLQWGDSERLVSRDRQSNLVRDVIFSRLPYTLLLVGAANAVLFFAGLGIAMILSTHQGRFLDRFLSSLTPISSAPSWVHGVILLTIFALELRILPFKGLFTGAPPEEPIKNALQILEHMALPVMAISLSVFFNIVYTWRTFFIIHSGEDYVELAKAKGLSDRIIRRRYLLRPTLPSVITSFTLMLVSFWESAIALEKLFQWPGMGALFLQAVRSFDRPVVVGIVVLFAYLLGASVILLDVVYAIIDPRVRVGSNGNGFRKHSLWHKKLLRFLRSIVKPKLSQRRKDSSGKVSREIRQGIGEQTQPIRIKNSPGENAKNIATELTQPVRIKDSSELHMNHSFDDAHEETNPIIIKPPAINISQTQSLVGEVVTKPINVYKPKSLFSRILKSISQQIFKFPMAAVGMLIIVFLIAVSIYTVIAIPYDEAVRYWHSEGWILSPIYAQPTWTNLFRRDKWPESINFNTTGVGESVQWTKESVPINENMTDIRLTFDFEYTSNIFPDDLVIKFLTEYDEKKPFTSIILLTPDGREVDLSSFSIFNSKVFMLSMEDYGFVQTKGPGSVQKTFGDPTKDYAQPLKGKYQLQILTIIFEEEAEVDIQGVVQGKVYGLFGTDSLRRNLTVAMLWGTPVALIFGMVGAILTTTTTILIAAISAWFGGWINELLQRITEINLMIPALPIALLVYILYSKSIWVIMAILVMMNIFGNSLKEYRAMFLQFKEAPYIEAAKTYGASNFRIIFHYLLPRIIQVVVPQLVISVPSYVFLEATLAYLGIMTPYLPTWGKVINMALNEGTFWGYYYWALEPIVLVLVTGLAFAFVGFALDKILNPRLREL